MFTTVNRRKPFNLFAQSSKHSVSENTSIYIISLVIISLPPVRMKQRDPNPTLIRTFHNYLNK